MRAGGGISANGGTAMLLMLLRHADAEPAVSSDAARRLTEKGLGQAERVGKFCAKRGICPELILSSPYARARQTADGVAAHLDVPVQEVSFLACGMRPERAVEALREHAKLRALMMVGHQPDLGELVCALLGAASGDAVRVRKASLCGFEIDPLRPARAELQFFVPASLM